jgi:hypothetical protein
MLRKYHEAALALETDPNAIVRWTFFDRLDTIYKMDHSVLVLHRVKWLRQSCMRFVISRSVWL